MLREMGHEREARDVAIAKQEQLRKHGGLGPLRLAWKRFLGITISHGYEPAWVFVWLFVLWLAGTFMFWCANRRGVMAPSEKEAYVSYQGDSTTGPQWYPKFHAPLYALDLFVPGIDLHQKSKWSLHEAADRWYWAWELGSVVYFVICWLLTLIGVGAVTGLIKPP